MAVEAPDRVTWGWALGGGLGGLFAVGLVYAAHLITADSPDPSLVLDLHRRWPAFFLLDTVPVVMAWVGALTARLRAAEGDLADTLAVLGPWADGGLVDVLLDGALLVDASGTIVAANRAATTLLRQPELSGLPLHRVLPDHDRTEAGRATERRGPAPAREPLGLEWLMTARRADDSTFPVRVSCGPATRHCLVYVLRPATASGTVDLGEPSRFAEDRARLEAQRDEAREANRAKSAFLAGLSHELRTPLNAIIGYTELIGEEVADAGLDLDHELKAIRSAATHLLALINNVLDLSKIEAGRMSVVLEPLPVAPLVREVEGTARGLAQKNDNVLSTHVDDNVHTVRADALRLRQVLLNLLGNACKFTKAGRVALSVRFESDAAGGGSIVFEVADTGIGMTGGQLERIFQEYAQASSDTKRRYGGTGLGLALSRRFVDMMGGTLTAWSEEGVGSRFTVRLPTTGSQHTLIPEVWEAPSDPVPGARAALVIADDQPEAVQMALQRRLAERGQRKVAFVELSAPAIVEHDPAAVVLDLDVDGASDVLAALAASPRMAGVPILVAAAEPPDPPPDGAAFAIGTPLDADELVPAVRHAERTASGCLVVGTGADCERVAEALRAEGWTIEHLSSLGQAELALARHRRAILVWVQDSPQPADLDVFVALRELPVVWVGDPALAPDGPGRFAVPLVDDDATLSELIALALHHRELPPDSVSDEPPG